MTTLIAPTLPQLQNRQYFDPNLMMHFKPNSVRESTIKALEVYQFTDDAGRPIVWTQGQLEIIDCIVQRSAPDGLKRIQIIASTQYGKSLAVAAGVVIRANLKPEKWAIVAGTEEKARIIMEYVIMLALNNDIIRDQLTPDTPLDRLRMKKSATRLTFKRKGEVRVYSAESKRVTETSKSLMGFGSQNVIEDESALVGDVLQATVMRMLGGYKDNFLVKIGNPFNRGHFHKTWLNGNYWRIFIDYHRAIAEGRYDANFIEEMRTEALFDILYECKFPPEDTIDARGWTLLLTEEQIKRAFVTAEQPFGYYRFGCDVAGGGRNYSVIVLRSYNVAVLLLRESIKDTMQFVGKIVTLSTQLGVKQEDIAIDKVGIGKGVYDRFIEQGAEQAKPAIGVNGGEPANDSYRFKNRRAEMYWRTREWIARGGKLEQNENWLELAKVKYKIDSSGRVQIMTKEEMLKEGIDSPDVADSLSMTFWAGEPIAPSQGTNPRRSSTEITMGDLDPFAQN